MITLDGKTLDLTNPSTWGASVQLQPHGSVTVVKDGVVTTVKLVNELPKKIPMVEISYRLTALEAK